MQQETGMGIAVNAAKLEEGDRIFFLALDLEENILDEPPYPKLDMVVKTFHERLPHFPTPEILGGGRKLLISPGMSSYDECRDPDSAEKHYRGVLNALGLRVTLDASQ